MSIVGLLGKKRSGKDTTADFIVKKYEYKKIAIADPLKLALAGMFGFDDDQLHGDSKEKVDEYWGVTPRQTLQWLGTEVCRNQMCDLIPAIGDKFWLKRLEKELKKYSCEKIVISDLRFQNEVDLVHTLGGTVIKLVRQSRTCVQDTHVSEIEIDVVKNYNNIIENNGSLSDLYEQIDCILQTN